jgi:uncharacterized protein (TIGR02687 family)
MQIDQLQKGLEAKFAENRIVFWYDPEQSFAEALTELRLLGVQPLNVAQQSLLALKKRIELDEPETQFLLYCPYEEPVAEKDWLLDIRLYSEQFFADTSSILLNELGITRMSLRGHLKERNAFFGSKKRLEGLRKWVTEDEDEQSLDRKMIAVLAKADSASLTDIILKLMDEYAGSLDQQSEEGDDNLPLLEQLDKYELTPTLWATLASAYGYDSEAPSWPEFTRKLFCTELWAQVDTPDKDWLLNNVLRSASGRSNAMALLVSWRDRRGYASSHDQIAAFLGRQLDIATRCGNYAPEALLECETFEAIEQAIIRGLVRNLLDSSARLDRSRFEEALSKRITGHWCQTRPEYRSIYDALKAAEQLLHLRQKYVDGFHFDSAKAMYAAYTTDLFRFDQAYRLFNEHADSLFSKGAEILRTLDETIEDLYVNWYLYELGRTWDALIESDQLMEHWKLPGIASQQEFYNKRVKGTLANTQAQRVFVIISDALRYEVAEELVSRINDEKRFKAELDSQLGVLPSYTQLGMASLLPHRTLAYKPEQGATVYVDDRSTAGLDNRQAILANVNGMAVKAKDLMAWSNQQGRDQVRGKEVVYIYHDTIDAIGDKLPTEDRTFSACRDAVSELRDLVARVINRLNGSRIVLTADHGFLFQQRSLAENDKTGLDNKPNNAIEAKKRYILGQELSSITENGWKGRVANTAGSSCDTEFLVPKGANRFHFVGGAKFVHGGAMLQEICVPVVNILELQKEQVDKYAKKKVGVVAYQPIKIVNNIDKVRFIQTDPVNDTNIPRELDIYIQNAQGQVVSSRERLRFDSSSKIMDERVRDARIKLLGAEFDRQTVYTLILEDVETQTRHNEYAVTIDLAFQDDFF